MSQYAVLLLALCGLLALPQHYKASKSLDFSNSRPRDSESESVEDDEVSMKDEACCC